MPAQTFELFEKRVVAWVGVFRHDLCAGSAVFVHDLWDAWLPVLGHVEGEGHVRCRVVGLQQILCDRIEHTRAEGTPAFAVFDLLVDTVGDAWVTWIAENTTVAERTWAKLKAALQP